jgi:quercetin dioxygenase-like cupin family protein
MEIIRRNDVDTIDRGGYLIKRLFTKVFKNPPQDVGFYESTIPKGEICKEQWHKESYEAVYFLTPGVARINGEEHKVGVGDLVIVDPGEKHEWRALDKDLVLFALRFPHLIEDKYTSE